MAQVYKCTEAGKTVYQPTPCATGASKELSIDAGPTEDEARAAKARADQDKARAGSGNVASTPPSSNRPAPMGIDKGASRPVDCAKLDQRRGEAYGRRNATIRDSRGSNIDKSSSVDRDNAEIRSIESQMSRGGCKLG